MQRLTRACAHSSAVTVVFAIGMLVVPIVGCEAAFAGVRAGDGSGSVSVGVSSGGLTPGSGGTEGPTHGGRGNPCTYALLPTVDQSALGVGGPLPGAWYAASCPGTYADLQGGGVVWIQDTTPAATPPISPLTVAEQAERSLSLPTPVMYSDPSAAAIVNLPTWFWIAPGEWRPHSVTATAGGVSATATATPTAVDWTTGDGGGISCDGPGVQYEPLLPADLQSTYCSYVYGQSSAGQPSPNGNPNDAEFELTATIRWSVSWAAAGAVGGGNLPPLTTRAAVGLRVEQIESVNAL